MKFSSVKRLRKVGWLKIFIPIMVAVVILGVVWVRLWYSNNLEPVDSSSDTYQKFVIELGESVSDIGESLEEAGLIRNKTAFSWYVKGDQAGVSLQAGSYSLSPSMSVEIIVNLLTEGRIDSSLITLLPAKRLDQTREELLDKWSATEVDAALNANYDHPVLVDTPSGFGLEGYIYPDTYEIDDSTTPDEVIVRTLDNFIQKIEERNLEPLLRAQGLNLHEAITLASIIEREAGSEEDKPKMAQVFLKRLNEGIILGADATFVYAAEVLNEPVTVDIDSPYNTRVNAGLPPGPIANFTITSLEAVAKPASGNYLYFVSGDDGNTYYSETLAEHQANTAKYCIELCKLPQ